MHISVCIFVSVAKPQKFGKTGDGQDAASEAQLTPSTHQLAPTHVMCKRLPPSHLNQEPRIGLSIFMQNKSITTVVWAHLSVRFIRIERNRVLEHFVLLYSYDMSRINKISKEITRTAIKFLYMLSRADGKFSSACFRNAKWSWDHVWLRQSYYLCFFFFFWILKNTCITCSFIYFYTYLA